MATQPATQRSFGQADPRRPTEQAASSGQPRDLPPRPGAPPGVDAHTAEMRERIAAASRMTVIGSLLLRR